MATNKGNAEPIHYKLTNYGFEFGSAAIERLCSDTKKGWVVLRIKTLKEDLQAYVTKTGKVRIYSEHKEWQPPKDHTKIKCSECGKKGVVAQCCKCSAYYCKECAYICDDTCECSMHTIQKL